MEFGFDAATARPVEVPVGVAYNCGGSLYIGPSQNLLDSGIGRTGSRDKAPINRPRTGSDDQHEDRDPVT
jgi:hypothetical protein